MSLVVHRLGRRSSTDKCSFQIERSILSGEGFNLQKKRLGTWFGHPTENFDRHML